MNQSWKSLGSWCRLIAPRRPLHIFLFLADSIASELAARWPVCIDSWLTVTGCWGFALHYRLLITLFWAGVLSFPWFTVFSRVDGEMVKSCVAETGSETHSVQPSPCWMWLSCPCDWNPASPLDTPPPPSLDWLWACNHGDSWSCYLLRGEGGQPVTTSLGY